MIAEAAIVALAAKISARDGVSAERALQKARAWAVVTATVDTASAQDLVITGTLASSGDTLTLESYLVELLYGA